MNRQVYRLRKALLKAGASRIERKARLSLQSNAGLWAMLEAYHASTESTGCQYTDYAVLYDWSFASSHEMESRISSKLHPKWNAS